jgi:hypothetical protein
MFTFPDDAFAPLRKSSDAHLAGKKRTYTPLDLKSKARSDTLEKLRANQRVDALALDLRDLKLDAANDGTDALDEDLYRKLTAWNLEKDLGKNKPNQNSLTALLRDIMRHRESSRV